MRGQVSVEYLVIVGIAIGLLIPAVMFFYSYNKSSESSSIASQVNEIGLQAISTAKATYALGRNARQTIEFVMPSDVTGVYADGQELVIVYETSAGRSEAVFFSDVNLTTGSPDGRVGQTQPGLTRFRFESLGRRVNVTELVG